MIERKVDHSALRTNQAFIIALSIAAFIADVWPLATFVALVMAVGTLWPDAALFKSMYVYLLKPLKIARPDVRVDNPEPHLFAQGVGAIVLGLGTLAFVANGAALGWLLVWVVIALAALNLFAGICVGCMLYYWFNRLGVPGFKAAPIERK
jgi:hypothetical protein